MPAEEPSGFTLPLALVGAESPDMPSCARDAPDAVLQERIPYGVVGIPYGVVGIPRGVVIPARYPYGTAPYFVRLDKRLFRDSIRRAL